MLFTDRSIWTMVHGIGLGGAALMGLAAAWFYLYAAQAPDGPASSRTPSRAFGGVTVFTSVMLWLTVIVGAYIIFPPYRATPPAGAADLSHFPRAMALASPATAWIHSLAMESKEHMPWIASMLATAIAFVAVRYRSQVLLDGQLRHMTATLLAICFALAAFVTLMGVFVNKVVPLQ